MAITALHGCAAHEKCLCEIKFMLISTDGRWVFLSSCEECARRDLPATNFIVIDDITDQEMADFIQHTPLRRWLHQFGVNIGSSDGS